MTLRSARLVNTLLLRVEAFARTDLTQRDWQRVRFSAHEMEQHTVKTVSSHGLVGASAGSLVSDLNINVQTLGLGVGVNTSALRAPLTAAAVPIDALVDDVTALLGISLGEADVRVNGVRCNEPALVG
jgi:uncharacterized membrane protein